MKRGVLVPGAAVIALILITVLTYSGTGQAQSPQAKPQAPITLVDQGSFFIGGRVVTNPGTFDPVKLGPEGETVHGDYAYVEYQIPQNAKRLPLVMWPGGGGYQTWESTPDGREGFRNIFLRRGWSVYILDPPFRGRAGRSTKGVMVNPEFSEKEYFVRFRLGIWPDYFPGVQFPRAPGAIDQWYAQRVPATGPGGIAAGDGDSQEQVTNAVAALFKKIGPAVLVTHSASGVLGWLTRMKADNIKAIVSYEDTNYVFPEGEAPPANPSAAGPIPDNKVPLADFMKLTTIPIQVIWGDNIPPMPVPYPGHDIMRARREMSIKMLDLVNKHGGKAELLDLPKIGIRGNTHFAMTDLNNLQIADLLSKWLTEKGLDK